MLFVSKTHVSPPGRFVTFEGGEGSGKTTLIYKLAEHLLKLGHSVVSTREPGAGEFGKKIREILLQGETLSPKAELFLFLADRANHVETIINPALERGEIVLCDRYAESTLVYQANGRGLNYDFIESANNFATGGLVPDLTLLLDIDPAVGLQRVTDKDRIDREPLSFHQKIRMGFLQQSLEKPLQFRVIDATESPEAVFQSAVDILGL